LNQNALNGKCGINSGGKDLAGAAHNSKHVLCPVEYVVCLLVVSTEVNLEVLPLRRRARTRTEC